MFELDIRTLLVITTLASVSSFVALTFLWRAQSRRNGAGFWAAGMLCIAIASLLISGQGRIEGFVAVVIVDSLYVIGFSLILRGIRVFAERAPLLFFDFILPLISAALFYYFNNVEQNINMRIVVISCAFMSTCAAIVFTLLRDKNAPWRSAAFSVAAVFGFFGVLHSVRGVLALISPFAPLLSDSTTSTSLVFLGGIFVLGGSVVTLTMLTYAVLESELRIFSHVVNQSASSIVITDTKGVIKYINPTCINKTGYSQQELIGENPRIFCSGEKSSAEYKVLWETLSAGDTWQGEFHNRKKNGELFWEVSSIAPIKNKAGRITRYVAMKEDITALKQAKKRVQHMANHDVLTKLPTRRLFMELLIKSLAVAKRHTKIAAVLFVDIDGFKAVNDTLGHDVGDKTLKATAARLSSCVREVDTVARIGGDEFLIILTNMPDKKSITSVAEKLVKAVAMPYQVGNAADINIGASIGIALYPDNALEPSALVNLADQAMYDVKRQGKNNYTFSKNMNVVANIPTLLQDAG